MYCQRSPGTPVNADLICSSANLTVSVGVGITIQTDVKSSYLSFIDQIEPMPIVFSEGHTVDEEIVSNLCEAAVPPAEIHAVQDFGHLFLALSLRND